MPRNLIRRGALTVVIMTSPALGADLPSLKAPPPAPPPPPLWTGFYAGLNAGYGFGGTGGVTTSAVPLIDNIARDPAWGTPFGFTTFANSGVASLPQSGFIGGGQIGYNFQWSPSVVLGVETDIQGAGIRGEGGYSGIARFGPDLSGATDTALGGGEITAGLDWLGTVRGRLGYLVTPTLLAYGTGGFAYGGAYARTAHTLGFADSIPSVYPTIGGSGRYSDLRVGWAAGGGAEWMFAPNWSLKAEALYYDLGAATIVAGPLGSVDPDGTNLVIGAVGAPLFANMASSRIRYDGVLARAGVNYHFDWGAEPIVAKY